VTDTRTRNAIYPQDTPRLRARSRDFSVSDIAWRINREIFKRRFLLTSAGGEIRAVMSESDDHEQ